MNRCVVNFADGSWYIRGQARLAVKCHDLGVPLVAFGPEALPYLGPRHEDVPYGFKPWCIERAAEMGYTSIFWMDASVVPQHPLDRLYDRAEYNGAWISDYYGHSTGRWASDACLVKHGLTRAEAFTVPHCYACAFCLCLAHQTGAAILREFAAASRDGVSFQGPGRYPDHGQPGETVWGHRWDQTVLSIRAHRHGIRFAPNTPGGLVQTADPGAVLAAYPVV